MIVDPDYSNEVNIDLLTPNQHITDCEVFYSLPNNAIEHSDETRGD